MKHLNRSRCALCIAAFVLSGCGGAQNATAISAFAQSDLVPSKIPSNVAWTADPQIIKEKVVYTFPGGSDGLFPYAGLITDATGSGGKVTSGTVFSFVP